MAQPFRRNGARLQVLGARAIGTAAGGARRRFIWVLSRESLLRLLLAVVLALALWLYVTAKANPPAIQDFSQPLPISTSGLSNNLAVTNTLGSAFVRIQVNNHNGPVTPASFQAYVDLSNARPLTEFVPVKVVSDPGIQVLKVSPSRVRVQIVAFVTRPVPVRIHVTGVPPSGYTADAVQVQPTTINVSGPRIEVDRIAQAAVFLDLSHARSAINGSYRVFPEDSQGNLVQGKVSLDVTQIHVVIPIRRLSSYKTVPLLASIQGQPKRGYGVVGVTINPPFVTAFGSASVLGSTVSIRTAPFSISRRGNGKFTIRVRVLLPKGVDASIHEVRVTTSIAAVETGSSFEIGISPVNVRPGLIVSLQPSRLLVTVVGPASAVRGAALHMRASLNLFGYGVGTFYLSPTIVGTPGVKIQTTYPNTVTVRSHY